MAYTLIAQLKRLLKTGAILSLVSVFAFLGACCVWGQNTGHDTSHVVHHSSQTMITVDCTGVGDSSQCDGQQSQEYIAFSSNNNLDDIHKTNDDSHKNSISFVGSNAYRPVVIQQYNSRYHPPYEDLNTSKKNKFLIQQLPRSHLS